MIASHEMVQTQFEKILSLTPFLHKVTSEEEYQGALDFIESLMLEMGDNPDDRRWPLLELASAAVLEYEEAQFPELLEVEGQSGVSLIRLLMEKHDLSQKDLPEIGSQGVVSEVLNGKRELNTRQIKELATRFNVDPGIFL